MEIIARPGGKQRPARQQFRFKAWRKCRGEKVSVSDWLLGIPVEVQDSLGKLEPNMPFTIVFMHEVTEDEDPETLTIQAYLGADNIPDRNFCYAGWRGKPSSEWCWPVVFKPSGFVDHGGIAEEQNHGRYSRMEIYDKPFERGATYVMKHSDGSESSEFVVDHIRVMI